jgi:FkbM family methyltransferase
MQKLAEKLSLIFRAWRYRTRLDRAEIAFLRETLKSGEIAVDIGAHKAGYSYWMLHEVGRTGQVFAFEPQPELAQYLNRIKVVFGFQNYIINHCGLSSNIGEMMLAVPSAGVSPGASLEPGLLTDAAQTYSVSVDTLDHYFAAFPNLKISFIKCDVEGHELEVFRGGESLLRRDHPVLMFECEERHHRRYTSEDVFDFLIMLGYQGFFFHRGKLEPLWRLGELGTPPFGSPDYVNNFVFRPATA